MLMQRIMTAIPLAVFVLWMIVFQPTEIFDYLLALICFIAGYEWARLSGITNTALRYVFAICTVAVSWVLVNYFSDYLFELMIVASCWWVLVTFYLTKARPVAGAQQVSALKLLLAFLILPAAVVAMHMVHLTVNGNWWLMYALALVWVADIGAYFSGKRFGKNKLLPLVSPGKTREGLYGALIATAVYSLIVAIYTDMVVPLLVLFLSLAFILTIISVSGDLYISLLKREAGLKDSGNILPGHGGILDRVDSVLAAMPVFAVGFHFLIQPVGL